MTQDKTDAITSEAAYDLVREHTDVLLKLLDAPMHHRELVQQIGTHALGRLLHYGLCQIDADGHTIRAPQNHLKLHRQEPFSTFLQQCVLPNVAASVDGAAHTTLQSRRLGLSDASIAQMRQGPVQELFDTLLEISDTPSPGDKATFTVLVVGTSKLVLDDSQHESNDSDDADDEPSHPTSRAPNSAYQPNENEVLSHLKNACLQRNAPDERHQAVLSQLRFLADRERQKAAMDAVLTWTNELTNTNTTTNTTTNPNVPTYHLTVACHWSAQ